MKCTPFINSFWFLQLLLFSLGAEQVEESCLTLDGTSTTDKAACARGSQLDNEHLRFKDLEQYGEDMGVRQGFGENEKDNVLAVLESARSYLRNVVYQEPQYEPIRADCKSLHPSCAFWASLGECDNNARYMNVTCAPVCQSCDYLLLLRDATTTTVDLSLGEDLGERQGIPVEHEANIRVLIQAARDYLQSERFEVSPYRELRDTCKNRIASCGYFASLGECKNNPAYMNVTCGPICQACEYQLNDVHRALSEPSADEVIIGLCVDNHPQQCVEWGSAGECDKNPGFMKTQCRKSCNHCSSDVLNLWLGEDIGTIQEFETAKPEDVMETIRKARDYLINTVYVDPRYESVRTACRLQEPLCAFWATQNECQISPGYMNATCGPVCQACEYIDISLRCPLDPNATNIWNPGDLNKMFERIISQPEYQKYEPNILSRPELLPRDTEENATYLVGGPWVITLENFLSPEEAQRLIDIGASVGYERSSNVGELKPDGTYEFEIDEGRTSTNAFCYESCFSDPVVKPVLERMEELTQIPFNFSEPLQLLKYEVGQYYETHHDYVDFEVERQGGVRILTVFLYLNDVEEGGGTHFPSLNLTVSPKLGRVLIWPSVLNDDPDEMDELTLHQALPVIKGIKYGANAWMHRRDYKNAVERNC